MSISLPAQNTDTQNSMRIDHLNKEQREAVLTLQGPLLIIAGAGSGKTGVITYRMAHMLEQGIAQSHILALTFTNKAAAEMSERIKELTRKKLSNLTIATFHSFGLKILKEQCHILGWRSNFTIYDTQDQLEAIKEAAYEQKMTFTYDELKDMQRVFSAVKTQRMKEQIMNPVHRQLYGEYEEFLQLKNAFDFDDLIVKPIKILSEHPDILDEYRKRFQYIMVDEFQDTSLIQYQFLYQLAKEHRNLCVVGDDDQSIYSWRGANYQNIANFERDFPERLEIKLEQNYRSTGSILKAANAIIANNSNRKSKELWTQQKELETAVQLRFFDDDEQETEFICNTIQSLRTLHDYHYQDFGILLRTNSLMRNIEEALLRHHIPYSISGGSSFFERKEIKDVIAYLKLIDNPDDDISFLRIINVPRRGVGKQTLSVLRDYAHGNRYSIYSAAMALTHAHDTPLSKNAKENLQELLELLERYRGLFAQGTNLAEHGRKLFDDLDYWGYLLTEYGDNEKVAKWRYDNVQMFFHFFERWEKNEDNLDPHLNTYLNRITLSSREDEDEESNGKVNLMTIHKAKGLEFDVTFIAGVEDGILPHARSIAEDAENYEEERRLFYVAVTRARKTLFLTVCRRRRSLKEVQECKPSPFLQEIPAELVETEDMETDEESIDRAVENIFSRFKDDKDE